MVWKHPKGFLNLTKFKGSYGHLKFDSWQKQGGCSCSKSWENPHLISKFSQRKEFFQFTKPSCPRSWWTSLDCTNYCECFFCTCSLLKSTRFREFFTGDGCEWPGGAFKDVWRGRKTWIQQLENSSVAVIKTSKKTVNGVMPSFPTELHQLVFSYLLPEDFKSAAMVSKMWQDTDEVLKLWEDL